MEGKASYYPWTVSSLAQTGHHNLLTFLAAAQGKEVDILPITWQGDLNFIGHGGTADLSQSAVDIYTSFAFKRMRLGQDDRAIEKANFDMLTAEMMAYTHPTIVGHPNISQLEGFCWEIGPDNSQLLPVLVFREADFGDMEKFMKTDRGQSSSLQERIKWCAELAKALQVLHENGIVHGDLKPKNVLVFNGADGPVVKLTDLGYSATSVDDTFLPKTWPWVAPEWNKRRFDIPRAKMTDIYSFGMLCLWIMFSGGQVKHNPGVDGKSSTLYTPPDEFSDLENIEAMRDKDQLPALAESLINNSEGLDQERREILIQFFEKTVRTDPKHRELSVTKLLKLLDSQFDPLSSNTAVDYNTAHRLLSVSSYQISASLNQLAMAVPEVRRTVVNAIEQNAKECKNHAHLTDCPDIQNAALQLAVCYEIGFGVAKDMNAAKKWLKKSHKKLETLSSIVDELREMTQLTTFREGLFKKLWDEGHISRFEHSDYHRRRQNLLEAELLYGREITDLSDSLGENHSAVITLRSNLASIFMDEGHLTKAAELHQKVLESALAAMGPDNHFTFMARANLASVYSHQGKWAEAEVMYRDLFAQFQGSLGTDHPSTIGAMANLGSILRYQGHLKEAEELDLKMVGLQQSLFGSEHPENLSAMLNLAATYRNTGKFKDAEIIAKHVVQVSNDVLDEGHPTIIRAEASLALTYKLQGRIGDAQGLHKKIAKVCEKVLGPSHPSTVANMHNQAVILAIQGQYKEAEQLLIQVIERQEAKLGKDHPDTLMSIGELGQNMGQQGRLGEAEKLLTDTLQRMKRVFGKENSTTLATKSMIGAINLKAGRYDVASDLLHEVIEAETNLLGQDHPSTLTSSQNLAVAYASGKRYEDAERLLVRVLEARRKVLGEDAMPTLITMGNLTSTFRQQGRYQEALDMIREVIERMTRTLGPDNPHTITSQSIQCNILVDKGSLQEADGLLRQLIVKKEQLFGAEHPETLSTKVTYAIACFTQHRVQEGTEILRMVHSIRTRVLGPEHPETKSVAELVAFIGEQTEDISNIKPLDSASPAG